MQEDPRVELVGTAQDLGCAIAHLRGDRTQAELARACGLTPAQWSLYENGRRKPNRANLAKVLRALGCTQLDLEEVAWKFRRRRLSAAASSRPAARRPGLQGGASQPPVGAAAGTPQTELRRLSAQFGATLEQLCALLERAIV